MIPQRPRSPRPRIFLSPPFINCPSCGAEDGFGVLMVCDRHYVRACWKCTHTIHVPLPKLRKRIIYLDQFVISNVMKELDPDTPAHSKGIKGGFYRTVFERLDRLRKL